MDPPRGFEAYGRSITGAIRSNYSFRPRSLAEEERDRVEGGGKKFKRTLNYFQLICLGVGEISICPYSSSRHDGWPKHSRMPLLYPGI